MSFRAFKLSNNMKFLYWNRDFLRKKYKNKREQSVKRNSKKIVKAAGKKTEDGNDIILSDMANIKVHSTFVKWVTFPHF